MPAMAIEPSDLVLQRALRWERERPERIYMTQPIGGGQVRDYTWRTALDEARRMAAHLRSLGLPPGSRVAILSKNCAHFILSDLAIWLAGHVSVALYPTLAAETVRYILEHSEAKVIFVGKLDDWDSMKAGVPEGLTRIAYSLSPPGPLAEYPVWEDIVAKTEPLTGDLVRPGGDTALVMYTSGSTGVPKGVEHTFDSMAGAARSFNDFIAWRDDDRVISYLPLAHAFERAVIETTSLLACVRIYFAESLDTFVADVRRARPTVFHSVPRLWLKFQQGVLRKMPQKKLGRMLRVPILSGVVKKKILTGLGLEDCRLAVSGSAPIPPELIQWYRNLGLELLEGYGMSENFCLSHVSRPHHARIGYVGNVIPPVECRLSDEGEILVKSPGQMKGYYKLPEETAQSMTPDGFFKTGDRGEIDGEGRLRITGRVKELFKTSKGKYVAPVPIENLLNANTTLEQSCVSGANQPQPFALVQLSEDLRKQLGGGGGDRAAIEQELSALRDKVNQQLDPHEHLQFVAIVKDPWVVENGLLTPSLKIRRSVIEKRYEPNVERWYGAKKAVIWEA
jgi:long-subunit acyl-CoA synthetase (AMP-forming)